MQHIHPAEKKSGLLWLCKILFTWQGALYRLPYAKALLGLILLAFVYSFVAYALYLFFYAPPPTGLSLEAIIQTQREKALPSFILLPLVALLAMLDAKRLRSMGALPGIAVAMNLIPLFPQAENALVAAVVGVGTLVYRTCLLLLPPRSRPLAIARAGKQGRTVAIYGWEVTRSPRDTTKQ